ncbi:conserved exported hypothetical protein [Burkholderia sp. 8Y]|uniref:hypothetical protein n=1 Tax=Burkholderia sp. 8Y TaxID=2653133 RepID=UPI0012F10379|nr:hypothetical protein [Burkholderia sp. 8Y]VXB84893.1 conserved exported hypothetical protein [Burkholderia sp. 8Y]
MMVVRNACFAFVLLLTLSTLTTPAVAKYTEEWLGSANVARAQAAPRASEKASATADAAVTRAGSQPSRGKSSLTASPFDADPIAAFADDPIAEFARPRPKRNRL